MMVMEGIKGGGGGGGRVVEEDMGDGMQCSDHPYRNNPGGICAFCLQEKLGKLVSSSFPLPIRASTSSSSSPSFRSDHINGGVNNNSNGGTALALAAGPLSTSSLSLSLASKARNDRNGDDCRGGYHHDEDHEYYSRRARISFLLAKKKKKVSTSTTAAPSSSDRAAAADIVFKRSKSTTTPRRGHQHFLDAADDFSPRKRAGFWSFLHHSSAKSSSSTNSKKIDKTFRDNSKISSSASFTSSATATKDRCLGSSLRNKSEHIVVEADDDDSPTSQGGATSASASSFERKVSRSRSVGCGSRSFSGDFFERISTGFGDCTLRRVESQREGKPNKVSGGAVHRAADNHCMKERVRCGGIFSGFMLTSSSSSSSSSSYWVSSSAEDMNGKSMAAAAGGGGGAVAHGRTRSWGWAFASPMRAFTKPSSSSKDGKRGIIRQASVKNTTPNLSAIPSLLAVRG